ncbi:MAG: PIG-L family deacetylase [Chloroflexi bacterium]|nr:PIG-L family deacetylase [Chloroflexota bacterium]MBU1749272.1 PIG-L family deacetylase [Chloroflexota bacterium]MBU1878362.1 PIG-L family deacetylase [Chloroflexota bacterium]
MNILVLTAHPDDAEFFVGGTLARAAVQGHAVHILIATNGERGSLEYTAAELREIRRREAQEAGRILGAASVAFLGHSDGFLRDVPPSHLREQLISAIRRLQADVVITFDPADVTEDHPDHRAVAVVATEAAGMAGLPLYHPEHGAVQVVREVYYFAKTPRDTDKVVDISAHRDRKIAALHAHASQMRFLVGELQRLAALLGAPADLLGMMAPDRAPEAVALAIGMQAAADGEPHGLAAAELLRRRPSSLEPVLAFTDWRPAEAI